MDSLQEEAGVNGKASFARHPKTKEGRRVEEGKNSLRSHPKTKEGGAWSAGG